MESAMTPMVMFGFALMGLGGLIGGIFGILLMVEAFKVSAVWGLLYLFVPFASLVFVVQHWEQARKPFLMLLVGLLPFSLGLGLIMVSVA